MPPPERCELTKKDPLLLFFSRDPAWALSFPLPARQGTPPSHLSRRRSPAETSPLFFPLLTFPFARSGASFRHDGSGPSPLYPPALFRVTFGRLGRPRISEERYSLCPPPFLLRKGTVFPFSLLLCQKSPSRHERPFFYFFKAPRTWLVLAFSFSPPPPGSRKGCSPGR